MCEFAYVCMCVFVYVCIHIFMVLCICVSLHLSLYVFMFFYIFSWLGICDFLYFVSVQLCICVVATYLFHPPPCRCPSQM